MHIECVSDKMIELARKLGQFASAHELILAGGTALALQIGHRLSVDFDFFTKKHFTTDKLFNELVELGLSPQLLQETEGSLIVTCSGIKVSVFQYPYQFLEEAQIWEGLSLAGVIDISSMKVIAITQRGAKRDFVDLYFVMQDFPFRKIAENMVKRFGHDRINPLNIGKGLVYFDDAESDPDPKYAKNIPAWKDIKKFFRGNVKQAVLDIEQALEIDRALE